MADKVITPDLTVRASSLSEAFDCPARFKAKVIDRIRMPWSAPALIGSAIHAGTAVYDNDRLGGRAPSLSAAMDAAREFITNPNGENKDAEIMWGDMRPTEAKDIAGTLTAKYAQRIAPQFEFDAVELEMVSLDITAGNGITIRFTGHIDRRYVREYGKGIVDIKSGKRILDAHGNVNTQMHSAQFGTYELLEIMAERSANASEKAGERILAPAVVVGCSTGSKPRVAVAAIDKPRDILLGDGEHVGLIDALAHRIKNNQWEGNPRSTLCSEKYCPIYNSCFYRR